MPHSDYWWRCDTLTRMALEDPKREDARRRRILRRVFWTAPAVSVVIWLAYGLLRRPVLLETPTRIRALTPVEAIVPSGLLGLALGALGVLLVTNRHRIGRLLRPSRGKIVAATLLTACTPESFLRILPIPLGLSIIAVLMVFVGGRLPGPGAVVAVVGPALIHYLASCLIISGIAAHGWRVAMFMMMWPASLSAVILMRGMYVGPM